MIFSNFFYPFYVCHPVSILSEAKFNQNPDIFSLNIQNNNLFHSQASQSHYNHN